MSASPTRSFTLTFAAITLLEIIGDTLSNRVLHYGCKPLIMALLILYVRQCCQSIGYSAYIRWLMTGMVFALIGDIFLMIREVDLFALGLGAFLLMQLCYSRAFWLSMRQDRKRSWTKSVWLYAAGFALYDTIFLVMLRPEFIENSLLNGLWWPVVVYVVCLSLMGILATQRRSLPGFAWVVAGALLFILSDSAIAIDKFLHPFTEAAWVIMSTYAAAQYLIVVGMVQQLVSEKPQNA
ncbi:lysoplasmalogenase [Spirosoma aureum]|uniref:Lysoplasmalogenase n=1 Tax=Spirosoma aureum TaxID=2692134 RepID=A0A6G9ALQ4_9BACT|nr:lysoplasmalogenase [Spirosoma aureum]QIP13348.1 lysoplasmalogenase [Spirosoma aureum]